MNAHQLFEAELDRRGLSFRIDPESGRHLVEIDGYKIAISLDNISRDLDGTEDILRMARFVDAVLAPTSEREVQLRAEHLFWSLEPNDYQEAADYRVAVSDQADRILIYYDEETNLQTWVTPEMLGKLKLDAEQAATMAFGNLGMELAAASLETRELQGVTLGMVLSELSFKTALLLAPNLKNVVEAAIGWPVLAVAPARDFLFIWSAEHREFAGRVGPTVVKEYNESAYPVSTEVFLIDDEGIRAIGAFQRKPTVES